MNNDLEFQRVDSVEAVENNNGNRRKNCSGNYKAILIILIIIVVVGVVVGLSTHFVAKQSKEKHRQKLVPVDFSIPSNCAVLPPQYTNVTQSYMQNWQANMRKQYPEKGYGFVAIIYPDAQQKTLQVALHIRGQVSYGSGMLGLPGGHVDEKKETIGKGALRELKEEAMKGHKTIETSDLHLISGSRYKNQRNQDIITGLYVLFVNDTQAVTGPRPKFAHEMKVDEKQGFSAKNRHRFIQWNLNGNSVTFANNSGLTAQPWAATLTSLRAVSQTVQCQFS